MFVVLLLVFYRPASVALTAARQCTATGYNALTDAAANSVILLGDSIFDLHGYAVYIYLISQTHTSTHAQETLN